MAARSLNEDDALALASLQPLLPLALVLVVVVALWALLGPLVVAEVLLLAEFWPLLVVVALEQLLALWALLRQVLAEVLLLLAELASSASLWPSPPPQCQSSSWN